MTRPTPAVTAWPAPADTAAALAAATGVSAGLLAQLRTINREQWRLEDISRAATTSDEMAAAKREIDASNARRHHVISAIDQHVEQAHAAEGVTSAWYSETVGELCDRLLILDLKHQALRCDARAGHRLAQVEMACQHLAQVAARMADDIQAGRAALPPRIGVKIYTTSRA